MSEILLDPLSIPRPEREPAYEHNLRTQYEAAIRDGDWPRRTDALKAYARLIIETPNDQIPEHIPSEADRRKVLATIQAEMHLMTGRILEVAIMRANKLIDVVPPRKFFTAGKLMLETHEWTHADVVHEGAAALEASGDTDSKQSVINFASYLDAVKNASPRHRMQALLAFEQNDIFFAEADDMLADGDISALQYFHDIEELPSEQTLKLCLHSIVKNKDYKNLMKFQREFPGLFPDLNTRQWEAFAQQAHSENDWISTYQLFQKAEVPTGTFVRQMRPAIEATIEEYADPVECETLKALLGVPQDQDQKMTAVRMALAKGMTWHAEKILQGSVS